MKKHVLYIVILFTLLVCGFSGNRYGKPYGKLIQEEATLGLLGTHNSLGYRVEEIEKHFHGKERWLGKAADQTADPNVWAANSLTPFVAISGDNSYGTDHTGAVNEIDEASVVNIGDTPVQSGMVRFDFHKILVTDVDHDTPYKLRIVYGSGTRAAAVTAG